MQRIRLDSLDYLAGRWCRDGKPFSGVAYSVESFRVVANNFIVDGLLGKPADTWGPDTSRVLHEELVVVSEDDMSQDFPEEGAYLNGTIFQGVAYTFDQNTGFLLREEYIHPTQIGPSREWYPSGNLKAEFDRIRDDGATETETWHENGERAAIESLTFGVGYTSKGRLRTMRLEHSFLKSDLDRLTFCVDSILDLAGPGFTDEIVERFEGLSGVLDLEIRRTNLSAAGLIRFHSCTSLRKLKLRGNSGFEETSVRDLLGHAPNCEWDGRLR
jgi:hypothetical protein